MKNTDQPKTGVTELSEATAGIGRAVLLLEIKLAKLEGRVDELSKLFSPGVDEEIGEEVTSVDESFGEESLQEFLDVQQEFKNATYKL